MRTFNNDTELKNRNRKDRQRNSELCFLRVTWLRENNNLQLIILKIRILYILCNISHIILSVNLLTLKI